MSKNKKSNISLNEFLTKTYGSIAIIIAIILIIAASLAAAYAFTKLEVLFKIICVLIPILILSLLLTVYFIFKKTYKVFYTSLYETTINNYKAIKNQKNILQKYELTNISDFESLNREIDQIDKAYKNVFITSGKPDYSQIKFEYINASAKTITEKSFLDNLKSIILSAQSYKNAIIKVLFNDVELTNANIAYVVSVIHKIFKESGLLIGVLDKKNGFYIFTPNIDSSSFLKEQLEELLKESTISTKGISGINLISPKINAVVYPFSAIDDIVSDLIYSESLNKDINIYIPNKYNGSSNETILQTAMDINNITKIISNASSLHDNFTIFDEQVDKCENLLKEYASYLSVDEGGIAFYDKEEKQLIVKSSFRLVDKKPATFKKKDIFPKAIAGELNEIKDNDCSYLFSSRRTVSSSFGRLMDIYNINSGFFYFIKNADDKCLGIIYLVNTKSNGFNYNSYIKESFLVMATTISYYLKIGNVYLEIENMRIRENNLMKMSNISSYTIDKTNYEVTSFTPSFKEEMPNVQIGEKCYKSFFGLPSPCPNCPLSTKNKVIKSFYKGNKCEVSYSINTKMSNYIELVVRKVEGKEELHNKFDADYLVNSYYSFVERLKNLYLTQSKGYVQLLTIDNIKELIETYGNEGFAFYIRCFASELIAKVPSIKEVFLYKDDTFAFIFPESGKVDIINTLELVYEYSKKDYLNDGHSLRLSIGYETVKYPQEFTNPSDLIRHLERTILDRDLKVFPTDTIHIEENDFYRPANRKEYILSIIEQAAKENKFIIKCQPVVKGSAKTIFGGEILIRLSDDYNNTMLNTEECIKVAGENNKLNTISDLLIDYVGNVFKQFGFSIFKNYGFTRISINADYNYFTQPNFMSKIAQTIDKYHLPKNFLTFEIAEHDLAKNYEGFKEIINELKQQNIDVVCDQYTGEFLSMDRLTKIHIKEIKTTRNFTKDMDVFTEKYNNVTKLLTYAKEQGIKPTLVGIENGQQYKLVTAFDKDVYMQGYYFYHSLEVNELIEAIRKSNN